MKIKSFIKKIISKTFGVEFNSEHLEKLVSEGRLLIGDHTYQWKGLKIDEYGGSEANVIIGKYCSISKNVRIITGGIHPTDWVSTFPIRVHFNLKGKYTDGMPSTNGNVIIGNDVWIGTGVTILSGVKIGDGAV